MGPLGEGVRDDVLEARVSSSLSLLWAVEGLRRCIVEEEEADFCVVVRAVELGLGLGLDFDLVEVVEGFVMPAPFRGRGGLNGGRFRLGRDMGGSIWMRGLCERGCL